MAYAAITSVWQMGCTKKVVNLCVREKKWLIMCRIIKLIGWGRFAIILEPKLRDGLKMRNRAADFRQRGGFWSQHSQEKGGKADKHNEITASAGRVGKPCKKYENSDITQSNKPEKSIGRTLEP